MGLIYDAGDSDNLIQAMKNNLAAAEAIADQLASGSNHLIETVDSKDLSGAAYTAGSTLFATIVNPGVQKVKLAIDDMKADLSSYTTADAAIRGYGHIDKDHVTSLRRNLEILIEQTEAKIQSDNDLASRLGDIATGNVAEAVADLAEASELSAALEQMKALKKKYDKELKALETFVSQTSGLFTDNLSVLQSAMQAVLALNQTTFDSAGNYSTNGADMSWLKRLTDQKLGSKTGEESEIDYSVSKLGLSPAALKYWESEMTTKMKNVPASERYEKLKEAAEGLQFDDKGNIIKVVPFMQGVMALKNGQYDKKLTEQANQEKDTANRDAFMDNLDQLGVGAETIILGGLLTIGGGAMTIGGGGFSLTGVGAVVGVPVAAGGATFAGTGAVAVGTGISITGNAISKINGASHNVQYSFAHDYDDRVQQVKPKAPAFEKELSHMPTNERVAAAREKLDEVAEENGWDYDSKLSKANDRIVFKNKDTGKLYAEDTQHGRFEVNNPRSGNHEGEIDIDGNHTKDADPRGHKLKVK